MIFVFYTRIFESLKVVRVPLRILGFVCSLMISSFRTGHPSGIFADHFSEEGIHKSIPFTYGGDANTQSPIYFTELKEAIHRTKPFTPREDKTSAVLFKGLSDYFIECLLEIYNGIWSSSDISLDWTSSTILFFLKPDKPKIPVALYRPIVLISVMCKICEKMISNRITFHSRK